MKIIESRSVEEWVEQITCKYCETVFIIDGSEVKKASFKVSGYHFTGTAVCEIKFLVNCPKCNIYVFLDPPEYVKMSVIDDDARVKRIG